MIAATAELKGLRVLVVEDQSILAMAMEGNLHDLGCEVVGPVGRLTAALQLASEEALDAAILDVDLAGTKVFPVAAALQRRGIPFMFLTGFAGATLPAEWRGSLCFGKPLDREDLEKFLRSLSQR